MTDELILVEKNGERMRVHPGTLENHQQLGWTVVDEAPLPIAVPVAVETPAPPAEKPKARKK